MKRLSAPLLAILVAAGCSKTNPELEAQVKTLTERVEKLESSQSGFEEIARFVRPVLEQQKAQEQRQAASEPDPTVRFAVTVEGNDASGPANAAVTVVEAFDFA